jgi:hypothetical protein
MKGAHPVLPIPDDKRWLSRLIKTQDQACFAIDVVKSQTGVFRKAEPQNVISTWVWHRQVRLPVRREGEFRPSASAWVYKLEFFPAEDPGRGVVLGADQLSSEQQERQRSAKKSCRSTRYEIHAGYSHSHICSLGLEILLEGTQLGHDCFDIDRFTLTETAFIVLDHVRPMWGSTHPMKRNRRTGSTNITKIMMMDE